MSGGNGDEKLDGYPLVENLFGSECRTKVGTYVGISDGTVGYSVGTSVGIGEGKLEGYPLGGK